MSEEQPTVKEILEWLAEWRDKCFLGMYSYLWSTEAARRYNGLVKILEQLDPDSKPDDVDKFDIIVNKVARKPEESEPRKMDREERMRFVKMWNSMCLFIVNYGKEMRELIENMEE